MELINGLKKKNTEYVSISGRRLFYSFMERLINQIVCCFPLFALGSRKLAGLRAEAGVPLMSDRDTELPPDHMTDHMTERSRSAIRRLRKNAS